jgi:hypothetical protein
MKPKYFHDLMQADQTGLATRLPLGAPTAVATGSHLALMI